MNKREPDIETCAFERGNVLSEMSKRTKQRFRIYSLVDKFQKNLKELKSLTNDKK